MIEKKYSTVGGLWAVASNGDFLRKGSGAMKVWSTELGAEKAAKKYSGKPLHLNLTQVDYYEPKIAPVGAVLELIEHVKPYYDAGIARTSIFSVSMDHQCNVLRHRPLGSNKGDTLQVGDEDAIVEIRLKFYADVKSVQDIKKS